MMGRAPEGRSGSSLDPRVRRRSRALTLEGLEDRQLLSGGTGGLAALHGQAHVHRRPVPHPAPHKPATPRTSTFTPSALKNLLVQSALKRYAGSFGRPAAMLGRFLPTPGGTPLPPSAPAVNSGTDHSGTNVQVAGVDEADLVKTDGSFLYILSDQQLVIVDARAGHDLAVTSRTPTVGNPIAQFLDGSRLTIISQVFNPVPLPLGPPVGVAAPLILEPPFFSPPHVTVTVFDVSNPAQPQVVQQTQVDGSYVDSRAIGSDMYLVLQNDILGAVTPRVVTTKAGQVVESRSAFVRRIKSLPLGSELPHFTAMSPVGGGAIRSGPIVVPGATIMPLLPDNSDLLSVLAFDTNSTTPGPAGSASVVGSYASTIYASTDHLYVFTPQWSRTSDSTAVQTFNLHANSVTIGAAGAVPGNVENPFSADEFGGFLRVATTTTTTDTSGDSFTSSVSNNVYVLQAHGSSLDIVGKLENLTPGEQLYAARFLGNQGFLVTFRQVDPLIALDLSNPLAPQVAGLLTLPGFSRYLQPLSDGRLLGIGRQVDPTTNETDGLQLSLFNVSDLAHPATVGQYGINPDPQSWVWSSAEFDHHAVSYFPEYQLLAIPVSGSVPIPQPPGSTVPQDWQQQFDLWVFHVDPNTGFTLLGKVAHDTDVLRSVRIGDKLFSISEQTIKENQIADGLPLVSELTYQADTTGGGGVIVVPPPVIVKPTM